MKYLKLFIILVAGTIAMNSFATKTANIKITVTDENLPVVIRPSVSVVLTQDDAVAADFSSSNNGLYAITYGNDYSLNMYVKGTGANIYQGVELPNINGLQIVFKANKNSTSYKMSFSDVQGDIKLMKGLEEIPVNADYTINCTTEEQVTFTLVAAQAYPRDIATGKWGTICYEEAISSVEGATIYQFTSLSGNQVAADVVTPPLAKGKAYLFLATADAQKFFYTDATKATQVTTNNGLIGKFADYTTTTGDEAAYVIKGSSLVPAAVGSSVPANRAYVQKLSDIPTTSAPARAGRMFFNVVNTPTGVEMLEAAPVMNGKMIINGQLVIIRDGQMFNAQGAAL